MMHMRHFNIECTKVHSFELFFSHKSSPLFQTSSLDECTRVGQTSRKEVCKSTKPKPKPNPNQTKTNTKLKTPHKPPKQVNTYFSLMFCRPRS